MVFFSNSLLDVHQIHFFKDLYVNKINYGKYLICKVIKKPYQTIGISLLVEDENFDIEDCIIFNYYSFRRRNQCF